MGFCLDSVGFLQIAELDHFKLQETVHYKIYNMSIVQGSLPFWEYYSVLGKYYLILPLSTVADLTTVFLE